MKLKYRFNVLPYLFFYFCSLGISHVYGTAGAGLLGRITASDIFLLPLLIGLFFRLCFRKITIDRTLMVSIFLWVFCMFLSSILSVNPAKSLFEMAIHIFALLHGLTIYILFKNNTSEHKKAVWKMWIAAGGIITCINLLAYFFFPQLGSSDGAVSATFRNSGQAGTYISIALISAVISFRTIDLGRFNRLTLLILGLEIIALILTVKRAAMIGTAIALVSYYIYDSLFFTRFSWKKIMMPLGIICMLGIGYLVWQTQTLTNEAYSYRFSRKITSSSGQEAAMGFFRSNYQAALVAFQDKPIFGVGLGGVAGVYTAKYEIHSTPLKVLATGGILGAIAYIMLMMAIYLKLFFAKPNIISNVKIPFILIMGLSVSFIYTYHIRKREYWVLIFLLFMLLHVRKSVGSSRKVTENRTD